MVSRDHPQVQEVDKIALDKSDQQAETPQESEPETEPLETDNLEAPTIPEAETEITSEPVELSDQAILESFVSRNQLRVFPIELTVKGFKRTLTERVIPVGPYWLKRGKYNNFYTIILAPV